MSTVATKEAAALCKQAIEIYSDFDGRLVAAIQIWQQALQIDPSCDEAKIRLAYALEEQRNIVDEMQRLDGELRTAPDDAARLYRKAYLCFVLGRDEEARICWQKVCAQDDATWAKSAQKMLHKKLGIAT